MMLAIRSARASGHVGFVGVAHGVTLPARNSPTPKYLCSAGREHLAPLS